MAELVAAALAAPAAQPAWPAAEPAQRTAARSRGLTAALGIARVMAIGAATGAAAVPGGAGGLEEGGLARVHVVGADFVEAHERAAEVFAELASWLARERGARRLQVLLAGPNVPLALDGRVVEDHGPPAVRVSMRTGTYEEALRREAESSGSCAAENTKRPLVALLFNAGIWGYDSWAGTLRSLCDMGVPTIVTSYNQWEAEDDHDSIEDALEGKPVQWLWKAAQNPFGSCVHRPSGVGDRTCADNGYWQCFQGMPAQAEDIILKNETNS